MALSHSQSGQKFASSKRFGEVIIRAVVQCGDFVLLAVAHRKDDNRDATPFAQTLQNGNAVEIGKAEIEDYCIGLALSSFSNAFITGGGLGYAVAIGFETDTEEPADLQLVIDYEHGWFRRFGCAHEPGSADMAGGLVRGNRIVNSAPPPGRFSALTV